MDTRPLSEEQRAELARANERAAKILRAARIAAFNGWTIGAFAVVTLLFGLFSPTALLVGLGLGAVAWNEFRGRRLLRELDPAGPRLLWKNQVGFLALIVVYCLWSIYGALHHPSPQLAELETTLGVEASLITNVVVAVYLGAIALSVLLLGLNARYYRARVGQLEAYLEETPGWIVELQRSTARL